MGGGQEYTLNMYYKIYIFYRVTNKTCEVCYKLQIPWELPGVDGRGKPRVHQQTKIHLQGDQLYMAVCFEEKVTCPVYVCSVAKIRQVTFYKVPEKHGHVFLLGCK